MAGGRIGGQGSLVQRAIWVFVSCCIVVAVWNTFPHDPKGFVGELGHKSEQLKGVAGDVADWLGEFVGSTDVSDGSKPDHKSEKSGKPVKPSPIKKPAHSHKSSSEPTHKARVASR